MSDTKLDRDGWAEQYAFETDGKFENETRWAEVQEIYSAGFDRAEAICSQREADLKTEIARLNRCIDKQESDFREVKNDNQTHFLKINQLQKELFGYYKMAEKGVWVDSETYATLIKERDQLRAKLETAKAALERIAGDHQDMGAVCMNTARKALKEIEANE